MNGRILRRRGHHCSILELDQPTRDRIGRLGKESELILVAQDVDLWTKASGPDFLPRVVGGAIVLQRMGSPGGDAVVLQDDGAHLAFITCTAMALVSASLEPELRQTLEDMLKLLAMCCPIEIRLTGLPPIESLPAAYQASPIIVRLYQDFREVDENPRDVMLSDALTLYRIFRQTNRPEDRAILTELTEATEGLRTALRRIRDAAST
jgi:hypothetical protein